MDEKKIGYCYIKGNNYTKNQFCYDGDEDVKEVEKVFDDEKSMFSFVANFSNYYSIAIQFYY